MAWREGSRRTSRLAAISNSGEVANRTRPRSSGPKRYEITGWIVLADSGRAESLARSARTRHRHGPMATTTARVPLSQLLRLPGFTPALLASMAGRLPASALGLVFILRTRELTGSYAAAGAVAGAFALANGITAPLLGRLVDRRGQGAVLVPAAIVATSAIVGFALLPHGAAAAAAVALAGATGAVFPPLGACLRTLWPGMLGDDPGSMHAAF